MNKSIYKLFILLTIASCGQSTTTKNPGNPLIAQVQTDTCDGPDVNINCCFINMPLELNSMMTIAKNNEPGEKLIISGTIFHADGKTPYPNIILYAYHTDNTGHYSKTGNETGAQKWQGRLHGWCKTDDKGHYEIHSIRPARYPDNSMPAHIHAAIKEPKNKEPYYISDFVFKDDSLVTQKYLKSITSIVGGSGIVDVTKLADGTWKGQRNMIIPQ